MTAFSEATPNMRRAVKQLQGGATPRQVMAQLGVTQEWLDQAVQLVTGTNPGRQEKKPMTTPTFSPSTVSTLPKPNLPPPPMPTRDAIAMLLANADDSTSRQAKRAATKIRAQLVVLREALDAAAEADQAAQLLAEERAQVLRDVAAARKALDAATARARALKLKTPSVGTSKTGDAHTIRAWAREHGVTCPQYGIVPSSVRALYDSRTA